MLITLFLFTLGSLFLCLYLVFLGHVAPVVMWSIETKYHTNMALQNLRNARLRVKMAFGCQTIAPRVRGPPKPPDWSPPSGGGWKQVPHAPHRVCGLLTAHLGLLFAEGGSLYGGSMGSRWLRVISQGYRGIAQHSTLA